MPCIQLAVWRRKLKIRQDTREAVRARLNLRFSVKVGSKTKEYVNKLEFNVVFNHCHNFGIDWMCYLWIVFFE